MRPLSKTAQGDICTIKWMFGVPEVLKTIRSMNIREGSTVQIIRKYRDCLILGIQERRIAIGYDVADRIQV